MSSLLCDPLLVGLDVREAEVAVRSGRPALLLVTVVDVGRRADGLVRFAADRMGCPRPGVFDLEWVPAHAGYSAGPGEVVKLRVPAPRPDPDPRVRLRWDRPCRLVLMVLDDREGVLV